MWTEHRKVICFTSISSHIPCHSSPQEERTAFQPMFPFQGNPRQAKQWWRGRSLYSGGFSLGMIFIRLGGTFDNVWRWLLVVRTGDGALLASRGRDQGSCKASCKMQGSPLWWNPSPMSIVERWSSPGVLWCMSRCLCRQNVTHHHTFPAAHHQLAERGPGCEMLGSDVSD